MQPFVQVHMVLTPLVVLVLCPNTKVPISGASFCKRHLRITVHKHRSVPFSNIGRIFLEFRARKLQTNWESKAFETQLLQSMVYIFRGVGEGPCRW